MEISERGMYKSCFENSIYQERLRYLGRKYEGEFEGIGI